LTSFAANLQETVSRAAGVCRAAGDYQPGQFG
jgi:hypothetical protein